MGAQHYSRYAFRFVSSLPDWKNTPADADPAGSPFDLPEQQSQAPSDLDLVAHASSPAQDSPVGAVVSLIDGLHSVTGLPWWATLSVTALGKADACTAKQLQQRPCTLAILQEAACYLICRCPCSFVTACCATDTSKCRYSTSIETGKVQQQKCLDPSTMNGLLCMLVE